MSQIDFPSNYCFAKQEKTRLLQPQTNDDARRSDGEVYPSNSVGQKSPWCLPRVAPVMGCRFSGDGQSFVFCGMPEAAGAPLSPRPEATPERTNHQRTQMFLSSHGNADAHLIHYRLQSEPASRIQEEAARWERPQLLSLLLFVVVVVAVVVRLVSPTSRKENGTFDIVRREGAAAAAAASEPTLQFWRN